ncbi:polysaccharide deacetylase family protein [Couchioplanes azureus]|nr:hypothetical protein [Couchioplanes caeruleus]GGQ60457.1 hypothetical protein GCM10010166_32600 [Couchioplanes caeruleus subsp. azureus]
MPDIACWTAGLENWPRLRIDSDPGDPQAPRTVEAVIPVGLWCALDLTPQVRLTAEVAGRQFTASTADGSMPALGRILRDLRQSKSFVPGMPGRGDALSWYVDMEAKRAQSPKNRYYEAALPGLPYGERLLLTITASVPGLEPDLRRYALDLVVPEFTGADVRHVETPEGHDDRWFVVMATPPERSADFDHIRIDFLQQYGDPVKPADRCHREPPVRRFDPPPLQVRLGDDEDAAWLGVHDAADDGGPHPTPLPILDRTADSLVFSVRRQGEPLPCVHVRAAGGEPVRVPLQDPDHEGRGMTPARLMIICFGIQRVNDLFSTPLAGYSEPKTYMQASMADPKALFSSRPQSAENGEPDGYAFTLAAHRHYRVKYHWAFNAGILLMMAHDSPEELALLRQDVANGLVSPSNAGYGAHRLPYYQRETNIREIEGGREVIRAVLGRVDDLYYPSQRLYKATAAEREAYEQTGVKFLVFDRSTVCQPKEKDPERQERHFPHSAEDGDYLWRMKGSDSRILLIEDVFRNGIGAIPLEEAFLGKIAYQLRRSLMRAVRVPGTGPAPVIVLGDDVEHFAGNGWFDGNYAGWRQHFNRKYQAALRWISRHPWVQAITTDDLDVQRDTKPEIAVSSSVCPSIDPDGGEGGLRFDQWYDDWARTPAWWVGGTLRDLSDTVENALVRWRGARNELYELAWLHFLEDHHEGMWSKTPVENRDAPAIHEPEDFVIAAGLQRRNVWVYLHAAVWGQWAAEPARTPDTTYVDGGPLLDRIRQDDMVAEPFRGDTDGLHWDRDLLPNVIVYNREVLLVLDRNGGVVTHVFTMAGGRPVSVSGTFKAYQFYTPWAERPPGRQDGGVTCDGFALQNTVVTPNHAYVAGDTGLAAARLGTYRDPRRPDASQLWLYPNLFDEYRCETGADVCFTYQRGTEDPPPHGSLDRDVLQALCERDRSARQPGATATPVIWHHAASVGFTKRISLTGRTVTVRYTGVRPGHVTSNEFCVDLLQAVTSARFQDKTASADGTAVTLRSPSGVALAVATGDNCRFTAEGLLSWDEVRSAGQADAMVGYRRLHRVLTDNLEMVCDKGGDFDYRIDLLPTDPAGPAPT